MDDRVRISDRLRSELALSSVTEVTFAWWRWGARRFSAKRKLTAVSRLMRASLWNLVARELNVTAARLSSWRDEALLVAEAALKDRERDDRDDEIARLKGKVGAMTMEQEPAHRRGLPQEAMDQAAYSLEKAGDRLVHLHPSAQPVALGTRNVVERLHEEFKRRIKTQTVLPSPETAAMLVWGDVCQPLSLGSFDLLVRS